MEIMDDVLDLKDWLEDTLGKQQRRTKRVLRGESGFSTLVTVLVIMVVGAIIITPLLAFVVTGTRAGETHDRNTDRFYAADAGIQDGIWRVSSGDYPDEWKGTWDDSVYNGDPLTYSVPDLNGCEVTVTLRPVWLLAGLETPAYGTTPHAELVTVSNVASSGTLQVVVVMQESIQTSKSIERIGVWIPEGFEYVEGSSSLEDLDITDPAYCEPTVEEWKNGSIITFDFDSPLNFDEFPDASGERIVISLDYTGTGAMTASWSWTRTNSHDIYLSWSSDIKIFQVESTATDPVTGASTTVVAGNMTNESVGTYLAYYGDYAVTGNALMRETGTDRIRDRLYMESPGQISIIPDSGTARKILLYWSGWKEFPENAFVLDESARQLLAETYAVNQVSLRAVYDGDNYDLGTITATEWTVLPNGSTYSPNGWSYGCNADVTNLVLANLPDDFVGNATYWVGHADTGGTTLPTTQTYQGVWGSSASDILVVGLAGSVLRYNGSTWSTSASGTGSDLKAVWGTASNNLWAVGASGTIRKYTGSWAGQTSGSSATLNSIWGSSATDAWVVGNDYRSGLSYRYTVLHTTNGGSSWSNPFTGTSGSVDLNAVWGSSASDIYAVGDGGVIRHITGATSWHGETSGTTRDLYGVWGTASNDVYAVGTNGTIRHWNGSSWSGMTSGTSATLYGIWGSSASDIYAVGASGTVLHYNGTSWSAMSSGSSKDLYSAWGTSSTDVYAVGVKTSKTSTILHWDGSEWAAVGGGTSLYTWVNSHTGETATITSDYPLSDVVSNEWANASWSIITLYTSPVTLAHQMYLFDTFRYWNSNDDYTFTLDGFLAPQGIADDDDAVKLTCYIGEGDSWYNTGEYLYVNGSQLNNGASGSATASANMCNSVSNSGGVTGYAPDDGIDLDTYTIDGSTGIVEPADSEATVRLRTGTDIWNLVYMILSFRSDTVGSGCLTYVVI